MAVRVISWLARAARAEGLEEDKKLKCKMVCYLIPGKCVGTRCYLDSGNGLSNLGAQIADSLRSSSSLRYY